MQMQRNLLQLDRDSLVQIHSKVLRISWRVACGELECCRRALDEVDTFVRQICHDYPSDVLFLQEGFRQTEGIAIESNHLLFTSCHLVGNLRCPAILFHERWKLSADVCYAGPRLSWIAVSLANGVLMVSLHLPHYVSCLLELEAPLDDLRGVTQSRAERRLLI